MLVLSRKLKQEILIGENIKITVLKVKGNSVRLGIEAPREVHVVRGEIPKKSDVVGQAAMKAVPETESSQAADTETVGEFTVVFTNTDEDQGSKVDMVPLGDEFECLQTTRGTQLQNSTQNERSVGTIQFRDKLPQVLQHNRLKEIVSQLTAK